MSIAGGTYTGQVDIKSAGTSSAPIVFQSVGGEVVINDASGQTGPSLSFTGTAYVALAGVMGSRPFAASGVAVTDSSHITINGLADDGSFQVTGTSPNMTLTRSLALHIQIGPGGSNAVISTNTIWSPGDYSGVTISDAPDTDITSNDFIQAPDAVAAVGVFDDSTGTSIENNIVTNIIYRPSGGVVPAVQVDASSVSGSHLDYNVVYPFKSTTQGITQPAYSWAGTAYTSASGLAVATGHGIHDLNTDPQLSGIFVDETSVPEINSADSSAPGMLATDFYGDPCTVDPVVAVTGAGTPAYCARGAVWEKYSTAVSATATAKTALSVTLSSSITQTFSDAYQSSISVAPGPTPDVSYTVKWGDGQTQTARASGTTIATSIAHTYAKPGTYTITDTANLTTGGTVSTTATVTTTGSDYTPLGPERILDTRSGTGGINKPLAYNQCYSLKVAGVDGVPANATALALNLTTTNAVSNGYFTLGNGGGSNLNYTAGQTIANSAIVPLTSDGLLRVCVGGNSHTSADAIIDATGYFTQSAASGYRPTTRDRILDTRYGTGAAKAKVPAQHAISVTIEGVDSIPSNITAVAVHVTETNATGGGFIAAEADGAGIPTTSSLNYTPGQTISNTLIVPVAKDGKIELYNGARSGSVDLIADVSGYFSTSAPDTFVPLTPYRSVDTRITKTPIGPNADESFNLENNLTGPDPSFPANVTVAANLTATDETAGGHLTAYPAGTTLPNVSNLNYGKGQTIANFGLFTTSATDALEVHNGSAGSSDLVTDIFGYFTNN